MSGNTPKILIVVVIVLVILFIVGIGLGASGGANISVNGVTDSLGNLLGSGVRLGLDEISSASPDSCLNRSQKQIILQAGLGSCALTVSSSLSAFASARSLTLQLSQGASVHYTLVVHPIDGQTMTVEKDLSGSDKVQFYKDGGTLLLNACQSGGQSACILTLG